MKPINELTHAELIEEAREVTIYHRDNPHDQTAVLSELLSELIRRFEISLHPPLSWSLGGTTGDGKDARYHIHYDTYRKKPIYISFSETGFVTTNLIINPFPRTLEEAQKICEDHYRNHLKSKL